MTAKDVILNTVTVVTGVCAVVLVVRNCTGERVVSSGNSPVPRPIAVADWNSLVQSGHRIGPSEARLTVVEFADYQCPVCEGYESVLDSMRARHPKAFAVVFHDFPLSYHAMAMPLAVAATCAEAQHRYLAFHDTVFAQHGDIGVVPIETFAKRAGVPDLSRFDHCMHDPAIKAKIDSDIARGTHIGVEGTPTVIAAGMIHMADMQVSDLEALFESSDGTH